MKYLNLQNLILFIIVLAVLGIITIIDWICSGLFDWYGHFLFIFIIIVLLKNITRLFVFPGSFWFWRRNMERIYSKRIASRLNNRVSDAIEILECLNQQSGYEDNKISRNLNLTVDDIQPVKKVMQSKLLNLLLERHTISKQQISHLEKIELLFKSIKLPEGSLTDYLDNPEGLFEFIKLKQKPQSGRELEIEAIQELQKVQQFLFDIYCELPFFKNCYRWLVDRTFGTPEMLKIELSNYFRTQEYQLKSYDGCIIDCLLLYATDADTLGPTVLFCQPNAGYYEYMMYESEWIDFYTRKNVNMFLWNYRGYGESKGFPNTNALLKDGEFLVDFINDTLKAQTLLLHGESLGGMVACHLGKTKKAQFLFADRTFSSISSIATVGISKVARFMFNLITSWNYDSAEAYIQCPYYKVLAMDPKDKIIPYLSSLKVEVGKQVLVKEFQFQHEDQLQFKFTQPYLEKWRWKCQLMFGKQKDIYSEVWNQHMMSKQDMIIFFEAIKRFSKKFLLLECRIQWWNYQ
ncbi:hypothetical protein pb186bvf_020110 [Paramecium bursaria]